MKKFLYVILIILGLLFLSRNIYTFYHEKYLLDTEAVVNIYPHIPDERVDEFFDLPKGTFDSKKHSITFSFRKFPGDQLDYYYNLPIRNYNDLKILDCNESFSRSKHQRFSRNEIIEDGYLYVRLINNKYQNFTAPRKSNSILATRVVPIQITYGKINNFIITNNNVIKNCP